VIARFNPLRWTVVILVTMMIVLTLVGIFMPHLAWALVDETGLIEQASPVFWIMAVAVAVIAAVRRRDERLELFMLAIVFAALASRELDLHKEFFGWSITRFINYTKAAIPLDERLGAFFLILLPLGIAAVVLVLRGGRRTLRAWRAGQPWPSWVAWWFVILISAFAADKLSGLAEGEDEARVIGWFFLVALEETLETILAIYTLLLMIPLALDRHGDEEPGPVRNGE
jgi:hypothetical protein